MKPVLATVLLAASAFSQTNGKAHTPDVDLAYYTFGARTAALPILVVNGGPGLSHVYMVQNDLWRKLGNVASLCSALNLEKFALLGDSYGGFLSVAHCARRGTVRDPWNSSL